MIGFKHDALPRPRIERMAESSWLLRFADHLDIDVNLGIQRLRTGLAAARLQSLQDLVPSYTSLLLCGDVRAADLALDPALGLPQVWSQALLQALEMQTAAPAPRAEAVSMVHRLPVCYGGQFSVDLPVVAEWLKLSPEEIIRRHCSADYHVALIGFAPGFAYLLGLDPGLQVPRRQRPRLEVPAGSIGLAGVQTGIYPRCLPGGWQLIGRTPVRLLDLDNRERPCRLMPGDRVRFEPIDARQFMAAVDADA